MVFKKGQKAWNKGRKLSENEKAKLRGRVPWNKGIPHSIETKKRISAALIGKKRSKESRLKQGLTNKGKGLGDKNPSWIDGRIACRRIGRKAYGDKCMVCGVKRKKGSLRYNLEIHHIDGYR